MQVLTESQDMALGTVAPDFEASVHPSLIGLLLAVAAAPLLLQCPSLSSTARPLLYASVCHFTSPSDPAAP